MKSIKESTANSNGVYSLYNGWLKEPVKDDIPEVELEPELSEWIEKSEECDTIDKIDNFIDDVYKLRQESILKDGEYGKGNLIFKEIRNRGILQELKDKKVGMENAEMSIEEGAEPYLEIVEETTDDEEKDLFEELNKKCIKEYREWANIPDDAKLNEQKIDEWALNRVSRVNNYDYNDLKKLLFGGK